jgi:exodeoxyribonuclease VII small subunit
MGKDWSGKLSGESVGETRPDPVSFESSLAELEAVVHDLEEGRLGLGEALARYEQGVKHLKLCYDLLQQAERKIELLTGVKADGTPITEPFEDVSEPLANSTGRRRSRKAARSPANAPVDEAAERAPEAISPESDSPQ